MCIIIVNPAQGKRLTYHKLQVCQDSNPDGMGIAYSDGDQLIVTKSLTSLKYIWKAYKRARRIQADVVLHFRLATHGDANLENAHPFYVDDEIVFFHNGILGDFGNEGLSDSVDFNDRVLKKLPNNWFFNEATKYLLEKAAADEYSKFVFMHKSGAVVISNELAGYWSHGNWFSNDSHIYNSHYYRNEAAQNYIEGTAATYKSLAEADAAFEKRFQEYVKTDLKHSKTCNCVNCDTSTWHPDSCACADCIEKAYEQSYSKPVEHDKSLVLTSANVADDEFWVNTYKDVHDLLYCGVCAPQYNTEVTPSVDRKCTVCGCKLGWVLDIEALT